MFVYLITNQTNGKQYVGKHSKDNLEKYLRQNVLRALSGGNEKRALYNAIRKYGEQSFKIESLITVETEEELDHHEINFIKILNTKAPFGYNLTDGGDGLLNPSEETRQLLSDIFTGREFSDETRSRMSRSAKERVKNNPRVITPELCENISKSLTGRKLSPEHIENMRLVRLGKKSSQETKRRISLSLIGNKRTAGHTLTEEHKRRVSESLKGHETPQETRDKISRAQKGRLKRSSHIRWHINRGIVNPNCIFCQEASNGLESKPRI